MSRIQQYGVALIALLLIYWLMPSSTPSVMTNAPGLPNSFSTLTNGRGDKVLPMTASFTVANPFGFAVQTPPTISVEQIERVLAEYNSPARGYGQAFYDYGQQYNINPAIALAFFIHESGAGSNPAWAGRKADGTYTHNVGNIICTEGWRCYGRFRDYDTWEQGIEDWYKLISGLYIGEWKLTTVEAIIPRYAPAADNNDEGAYIQSVKNLVESWKGK